jgi:hypothetical protein
VIEVIDHLLSAPAAPATIALAQPNVLYEFAIPALEAESAGRKLCCAWVRATPRA